MDDQNILIIGGTGSLGHELTSHFIFHNKIGIFSRDENKQWNMKMNHQDAEFFIGDVRDKASMIRALSKFRPNIIIFAAAQKHIDICEREISESINTNILGIRNLIEILEGQTFTSLNTVLFVSTDKACNPINAYGQCKAIAEKLMIEASRTIKHIKFVCVRYGNVINSRGSLIPLFKDIASNPTRSFFPVTSQGMTRFLMSLSQAVNLIETSILNGNSGEIWIFLARSFYIDHIAKYFSIRYSKPIHLIGIRNGEKLHEELYSSMEEMYIRREGNFAVITRSPTKDYKECKGFRSDGSVIDDYDVSSGYISQMVDTGSFSE